MKFNDESDQTQYMEREKETIEALHSLYHGETIDGEAVLKWLDTWGTEEEIEAPEIAKTASHPKGSWRYKESLNQISHFTLTE